ncbi:MAG: hypothetical protein JHC95_01690 [Solirubrobacteraceae bacterium]|nr:hypothetical protein [Solirubrobacteraceae bacterium]
MKTIFAVALAAVFATALLAAPAHASRLMFWTGEEMHGSSGLAGYGVPKSEDYWDLPRDLSVYTPALWDVLERHQTQLGFNFRYRRDFGPRPTDPPQRNEVLPFLREAARRQIPIKALIQVPYADGYWSNEDNGATIADAADAFDRWARQHGLRFTDVSLDLESSIQDTDAFFRVGKDPVAALGALAHNAGPRRQCRAAEQYRGIVRSLRGRGYAVTSVAHPFVIDDALDGKAAFSDFFDLPLIGRGQYDDIGFMTMRTIYVQATGVDPGPSLQLSYGRDIRRLYGDEGGISLGEAGVGPYKDVDVMATDVRAAASSVDGMVGLYSIEQAVKAYGVAGVERIIEAGERPLTTAERNRFSRPSAGTLLARTQMRLIDALAVASTSLAALNGERSARANRFWGPCRT